MTGSLTEQLFARARELGFDRVGVARAEPLTEDSERLRRWLAAGYHGSMDYLARTADARSDPAHPGMLPSVKSVVVLATAYARADGAVGPAPARVARYARGRDYHNVLYSRLRKLNSWLRAQGHQVRAAVDTMPVLERAWAQRAGLGFIGKNGCLIVPGLGSHLFLSALVTSAVLEPSEPMAERCGQCRLCLDACPTRAFVAERVLDARRCISYLTIEHRGAIEPELRAGLEDWAFGCDACQDVCPFNRTRLPEPERTAPFAPDPRFEQSAESWLLLDEAGFAERTQGSPLRRTGREGMARNLALVLGNRGERRHLPVLQRVAADDPSPVVREAAGWAIARLERA